VSHYVLFLRIEGLSRVFAKRDEAMLTVKNLGGIEPGSTLLGKLRIWDSTFYYSSI
jgi:hypothetical protein